MRRSASAILFLTIFIDLLGYGVVIPLLPAYARDFGASALTIGLLVASYSAMQFLFSPILGGLSDRLGRRPVLLATIAINVAGSLILGLSASLAVLFVARLVAGIAAANLAVAQAYLSDVTPPAQRSKAFGMIGAATGLGFVFGPPLGGLIASNFGLPTVGYAVAGLCLLNLALAFFRLPETRDAALTEGERPLLDRSAFRTVVASPALARLFGVYFLFIAGFAVLTVVGALLWIDRFALAEGQVGYTFGLIGIVMALVQGLIGRMTARFGEQHTMVAGLALMTVSLAVMPLVAPASFVPVELMAIALFAVGYALALPTGTALVALAVGAGRQGQILGQYQSVGALARIVGPLIGGAAYQLGQPVPFFIGTALMALALVLAATLRLAGQPAQQPAGAETGL
jgi:multidrug resistance protein